MKRKVILSILGLFLVFIFIGNVYGDESKYPVMSADAWVEAIRAAEAAPKAEIDEGIKFMLNYAQTLNYGTSLDLSGHIDYDPNQRSQGSCGNCWVWAGIGVMEIAHDVNDGVFDRLSIQFLNSCRTAAFACCGGGLGGFANWYSSQSLAVPWDNANAAYDDGGRNCAAGGSNISCADISTTPNYPIDSISQQTITTFNVDMAVAVNNIKNVLNQNKGVYFGFSLPDGTAWDDFRSFWADQTETTYWGNISDYCGDEWDGAETGDTAGGHAVVIYGYNDENEDPAAHYWLALNSWGTTNNRPNGFFRIPMWMNYNCFYPNTENQVNVQAFSFETLNVVFGNAVPIADAGGSYSAECQGTHTEVLLDGSGSTDLDGVLTYSWSTDCPEGSFDDATNATPTLTMNVSANCTASCNVSLTVTDDDGASDSDSASVAINDTTPPLLTCAPDTTTECFESTDPSNTGTSTADDECGSDFSINYSDVEVTGSCQGVKNITRTWTATDACGNSSSCVQTIDVVDTTPPEISCNASDIIPKDAPISFKSTATDNCDSDPSVEIISNECIYIKKKGEVTDKGESCVVDIAGDTINILDSGGIDDRIKWRVRAVDCSGNTDEEDCFVYVVKKVKP